MSFEQTNNQTTRREESLIPNTQIESMFMRVCKDEEMKEYVKLVDEGHISLATAYASNKVYKIFYNLVEEFEKFGRDVNEVGTKKIKK